MSRLDSELPETRDVTLPEWIWAFIDQIAIANKAEFDITLGAVVYAGIHALPSAPDA